MLKRLYNWGMERVSRPDGEKWLFGLTVAEATFFPIPPDVLLIPMVLADRARLAPGDADNYRINLRGRYWLSNWCLPVPGSGRAHFGALWLSGSF